MKSNLVLIAGLLAAFAVTQISAQEKCDRENLVKCSGRLLRLVKENLPVPSTIEEVQGHCSEIRNASRCARGWFRECADPSSKQIARMIMSGVTKRFNKNCSPEGMQRIIDNRDCIEAARMPLRQCYKSGLKDMFNMKTVEKKKWHSLTCCFASKAHHCVNNAVKQNCRPDQMEMYLKESTQLTDELTDTFCPSNLVWGKSQCASLVAEVPDNPVPKDASLVPILLDVMKEIQVDSEDTI